ncbi:response regulator [Williamsia phyllosphaerae]|uniref:Transcriptional regulatory protein n=1 Tax=Williamsia phyllosphaerae TaxID=885042 RepID=A0ABQ1UBT3_9NOCA|nr:response regulator [Williamsia phyllosphaerae]GGF13245.1 transcriptional regulatory protein [Williamsia phyllosphaerae]
MTASDPRPDIRVLIVEDEPLIAAAHEAYVERIPGFVVAGVAGTARAALRTVAACVADDNPIDVVLLDIGLPDASGIELASALSGQRPEPDIIAITSERDLSVVRAAVAHGVLLYLLKPFTFAAFRDKLERYRGYRDALPAGTDAAGQQEVDRAMAVLRGSDDRASAPAGASGQTTEHVARCVRDSDDGLTASEAAVQAGVSRVTAWRYLERLADDGVVARSTEYGRAGRPQVRYRWQVGGPGSRTR